MFQFALLSDRIRRIRERRDAFAGGKYMTINSERTKIYTDYYKAHENEWPLLKRAGALYAWCATKRCSVFDDDIFVGTTGPDERSLSPYVEWSCAWIPGVVNDDDETFRRAWQSGDSIKMTDEQRAIFREAYEYWKDRSLNKMVEGALTEDFWESAGNGGLINSQKAARCTPEFPACPRALYSQFQRA
jgi:formate C-acetyltransferase